MAAPTLSYGGTTVTLPYPSASGQNERSYTENRTDRRTVGGILRTAIMSKAYEYRLSFEECPIATYDEVVSLWQTATAAGAYPVFNFASLWATANGVQVSVLIGPIQPAPGGNMRVGFQLGLAEVSPR